MQPTHRERFEYALQSDLLRAIRRHRRTAEDHYTREPKRAEISRLSPFPRQNPEWSLSGVQISLKPPTTRANSADIDGSAEYEVKPGLGRQDDVLSTGDKGRH